MLIAGSNHLEKETTCYKIIHYVFTLDIVVVDYVQGDLVVSCR